MLPSSLFSNSQDSIFINTREILLRDFYILALCEFDKQSFFKTNTQPVILFALRKDRDDKNENTDSKTFRDFYHFIKNNEFDKLFNEYKELLESCLKKYSDFMNYDLESLYALFSGNLSLDSKIFESENFKAYKSAYKAKKQKQTLLEFIKNIENEKFLYFCYCLDSKPLIIKSPKDNDAQKKFLGYFWSDRKGHEGIHYYKKDSNDLDTASNINTPLFNPKNKLDTTKLSFYILQNYLSMLSKDLIDDEFLKDIDFIESNFYPLPKDLESFAFYTDLKDCIDFSKVEFDKAISLNISHTQSGGNFTTQNPFKNYKGDFISVGDCGEMIGGLWKGKKPPFIQVRVVRNTNFSMKGELKLDSEYPQLEVEASQFEKRKLKYGDIIIEKSGGSATQAVGRAVIFNFKTNELYSFSNFTNRLRIARDDLNPFYVHLMLNYIYQLGLTFPMQSGMSGLRNLNLNEYKNIKIPKPPLEVQEKIVKECEKVEEQYKIIRMSIEEYQRLIKAILMKCGVIADEVNGGGGG